MHVLAIDDDKTSLMLLRKALEHAGHEVQTTTDPPEALCILHKEADKADLCLPKMNDKDDILYAKIYPRLFLSYSLPCKIFHHTKSCWCQ